MDPDAAARYVVKWIDGGAAEGGLSRKDAVAALEHAIREADEDLPAGLDYTIERQVLALLYADRERVVREA